MEIEARGDHVAIVVEILVFDVLVSRPDILKPNVSIGTVDRDMVVEEKLKASPCMETESILRIAEVAGSTDCGVIPPAAAEEKRCQTRVPQGVDQRGNLHRIGVDG